MDKNEIFEFLNKYPTATLATSDNGTPHVRYVWTVQSDENGILFHTGSMKDLYRQLMENPCVEFCFVNEDKKIQIRVAGTAVRQDDEAVKQDLVAKRGFLKDIQEKTGSLDFLQVFRLKNCRAVVWTFDTNLAPKESIALN